MARTRDASRFDPPPRALGRAEFVARFGSVYEHSPWVAQAAFDRRLSAAEDTPQGLAAAMAGALASAGHDRKLALIRAHPDLAGRAAVAGELTSASRSEQASAGLGHCTPGEYRRFQELNAAYKQKFGFPFILAVAGKMRHDILAAFESRIGNDPATEFETALDQINRIALVRLEKLAAT